RAFIRYSARLNPARFEFSDASRAQRGRASDNHASLWQSSTAHQSLLFSLTASRLRRSASLFSAKISARRRRSFVRWRCSEEHTSELQSHLNLVCRLLLEKKKK